MRPRSLALAAVLAASGLAFADSAGPPLDPVDFSIVREEPCDPKAARGDTEPLVSAYMCQIGLDGQWFQPYPCEVITSTKRTSYLRFAKWNIPCEIVGTLSHKSLAFDGSMMCDPSGGPANMIGNDALVGKTKLVAVAGGFRVERKVELVKEFASGPDDARQVLTEVSKPKLTFNVCRRPWPKGFVSDNQRAAAMRHNR